MPISDPAGESENLPPNKMKAGSKNVLNMKIHVSKGDLGSVFMVMDFASWPNDPNTSDRS